MESYLLQKEIGTKLNYSTLESIRADSKDFDAAIGMLYPYYTEKKELPLTAWGYIYNQENPKKPIFWPPSMQYFTQFVQILEKEHLILNMRKVPRKSGNSIKNEIVCTKSSLIFPTFPLPNEHTHDDK